MRSVRRVYPYQRLLPIVVALAGCAARPDGGMAGPAFRPRTVAEILGDGARRKEMGVLATEYLSFVGEAKTERLVVRAAYAWARRRGAVEVAEAPVDDATGRVYTVGNREKALAIAVMGVEPIERGVNVFVAPIDAPGLGVKQNALFEKEGFTLWDARAMGRIAEHRWLSLPLALYGFVAREKGGGVDIAIGDRPDDPVFVVPDLLPHLARRAQARRIIDPEKAGAIAGIGVKEMIEPLLAEQFGVSGDELSHAELSLVPAGRAAFVGVDRGLIAGYGHSARAAAFAFVRAVLAAKPRRASIVVLVGQSQAHFAGNTGLAFVRHAIGKIFAATRKRAGDTDEPALRRVLARSLFFAGESQGGRICEGPVLNQVQDDAFPEALRATLRALDAEKVPVQFEHRFTKWPVVARTLTAMNADAVGLSIAVSDVGAPIETISTVDIYSLYLAARAIAEGSR